jgi:hypothetical protein
MKKLTLTFLSLLSLSSFSMGSRKPCLPDSSYVRPFDSEKLIELTTEAWTLGRSVLIHAENDNPIQNGHSLAIMYDSLSTLHPHIFWIKDGIKKHPESARCYTQFSADVITANLTMVRNTYRSGFLFPSSIEKAERLVSELDEILSYYQVKPQP